MAHVDKFTRAATGHLCAHYERARDGNGEYIRFGNQNIDAGRTPLNYNLAPSHEGGQVEFIRRRTSEVKCLNRADVNVMCSWIVTLPQGFPWEMEFFKETYKFLAERYGEKNVVSAYVHMDESQPHMHFSFVPVVTGKDGKEKVSAKELLNKAELQGFHPALQASLERALGEEVPVLNGATAGGNRTVAELKAEAEIANAQNNAVEAVLRAEKMQVELEELEGSKRSLEGEIGVLQAKIMTEKEVMSLKGKKTLTGGLKGVSYVEYESLRQTARRVNRVEAERDKAMVRAKAAEQRAAAAEEKAKRNLKESPALKMQMENASLKARLKRIEDWLTRLLSFIPEQLRGMVNNILRDRDPFEQEQRQKPVQELEL